MKEKKIIAPRRNLTIAEKEEELLNVIKVKEKDSSSKKKGVHRLTLDIPDIVFEKVEAEAHAKGYTYRELIVTVLRKYFDIE
jgi:predicted DNA binding CopG/RHH family protein